MAASGKNGLHVIGVIGYATNGKNSLCQHLQRAFPSHIFPEIVSARDYLQQSIPFDPPLASLYKWPNKRCPQVFLAEKNNSNQPASVNEPKLLEALQATIQKVKQKLVTTNTSLPYFLFIEDFFLFTRASILPHIDRVLVLDVSKQATVENLLNQQYESEYKSQCTFEEFRVYWETYVLPNFRKWNSLWSFASLALPFPFILIDCSLPSDQASQQAATFLGLPSSSISSASLAPPSALTCDSEAKECEETIICISDIHGHISKLEDLWTKLEEFLGPKKLQEATLIFLGDYCDRGPHTKDVLDWLVALKEQREQTALGKTIFLAGNHDFAFGAFLGCPPLNCKDDFDLDSTINPHGQEMYWKGKVDGGMHYQGRRWAGAANIYETIPSFASYGVKNDFTLKSRNELLSKVPQAHKDFLQSLLWVHDQPLSFSPGRLICVHAGLVTALPLEPQMTSLKNRRAEDASLQSTWGRFDALSGRGEVLGMHPELEGSTILVSGHHGVRKFAGNRFVLDLSGGKYFGALEALILSACGQKVISSKSTD